MCIHGEATAYIDASYHVQFTASLRNACEKFMCANRKTLRTAQVAKCKEWLINIDSSQLKNDFVTPMTNVSKILSCQQNVSIGHIIGE